MQYVNISLIRIHIYLCETLRCMILWGDWLCAVWYCREIDSAQYTVVLQGDWLCGEINSAQYGTAGRLTLRSLKQRGDWLCPVWYCREIDSAQYDTAGRLILRSMILRGDWLCAVMYCREIDSAQYDNAGRLTLRSMIQRGDWLCALVQYIILQGHSENNWITRRNLNQNQYYFNPLVRGPGQFE